MGLVSCAKLGSLPVGWIDLGKKNRGCAKYVYLCRKNQYCISLIEMPVKTVVVDKFRCNALVQTGKFRNRK